MVKGISNVCQRYNGSVLFKIKPTPGDKVVLRTSGGIYTRPIPEGYYMNRDKAQKQNSIVKFYKAIKDLYKNSYLRILFKSFSK